MQHLLQRLWDICREHSFLEGQARVEALRSEMVELSHGIQSTERRIASLKSEQLQKQAEAGLSLSFFLFLCVWGWGGGRRMEGREGMIRSLMCCLCVWQLPTTKLSCRSSKTTVLRFSYGGVTQIL